MIAFVMFMLLLLLLKNAKRSLQEYQELLPSHSCFSFLFPILPLINFSMPCINYTIGSSVLDDVLPWRYTMKNAMEETLHETQAINIVFFF